MNNVMIISSGQQRDAVTHLHASILSQTPSHPGCHITWDKGLLYSTMPYHFHFI